MKKYKKHIGITLISIGLLMVVIFTVIYRLNNPTHTETQLFLKFWYYWVISITNIIIGFTVLERNK